MKIIVKFASVVLLGLFSLQAIAERVNVHFADGKTVQREATVQTISIAEFEQMQRGATGLAVTLDTSVAMYETAGFTEIVFANPGQEVNFSTFFNQLGSLEVPFEGLVGRPIITAIIAPSLGIAQLINVTIEPGDENVVGYGIIANIPVGASTGPFFLAGRNQIGGIVTLNNIGFRIRVVSPAPPAG